MVSLSRRKRVWQYIYLVDIIYFALLISITENDVYHHLDGADITNMKYKLDFAEVSILIPLYNKAHYLQQSLDSVFKLPMKSRRFRVLILDDCSTDNSSAVIKMYQKIYPNIDYYRNNQNLGTHVTRIRCVMYTRTKYLIWLDPDDCFIGRGAVDALDFMKKKDAGVVEFGCRTTMMMNRTRFYSCWRRPKINETTALGYKDLLYKQRINCHLHRKVFRTDTFKKAIMAMPEYVRNARIMRCQDNLQIIFYAEYNTRPYYFIKKLGEERHHGLPDNSLSGTYQHLNISEWHCRLQNQYLYDIFGRCAGRRLRSGESNVSVNVPEVPAIPKGYVM